MAQRERSELEALLGHAFARPELLEQALTHASLRHEAHAAGAAAPAMGDNERLEFLGDAIVGLATAELLYRRYPELDEGELTRLRAALVSRRHLGQVGFALELGEYLRLSKAEERAGGRTKSVLLANGVEAIIAALYLEGGLALAAEFIGRHVAAPYLDALRDELRAHRAVGDYKTALQEFLQGRHSAQPEYRLVSESGPDHRKRFVVEVRVRLGQAAPTVEQAEAGNKKRAEQEAARLLYQRLSAAKQPEPAREPHPAETNQTGVAP